jgi:hypothetical protein
MSSEQQQITHKARIIQNTTHISNEEIKRIIEFVNPMKKAYGYSKDKKCLDKVLIRVIRDSDRDKEFHDTNARGSYLPWARWKTDDGLIIIDNPMVMVSLPDPDIIKFPVYSNLYMYEAEKDLQKEHPHYTLTKEDQRMFIQARIEGGKNYAVTLLLSLEEYLVYVFAHELRHHFQAIKWLTDTRTMLDDTDESKKRLEKEKARQDKYAERYAINKLRLWRKMHTPSYAYPSTNRWIEERE